MRVKLIFVLMACTQAAISQTFTEKIIKVFAFEKRSEANALVIANINGNIIVSGYDGDKIQVEVTRTIKAKTPERLDAGKAITLGVIDLADTLIFYTQGLCSKFGRKQNKQSNWGSLKDWGYDWDNQDSDECLEKAEYKLDFVVRVPRTIHLVVSTVNQGQIKVDDCAGSIVANNINGGIALANISREVVAHTINGNVDITYLKNPQQPCRFYSLNGDINAWFQKGLKAELSFESFNGQFYTNVTDVETKPIVVEQKNSKDGLKFKVKGNQFKIGTGGVQLDFETFNGNVYLKEKS
jgi:DUF4097 and DUF4098 domain-containing protein YvlB